MVDSRISRLLAIGLVPALGALVVGCSGDQNPLTAAGENQEKPADSVYRESSPQPRSGQLESRLDTYRQQTYLPSGVAPGRVPHDDVPYTAAYRHAIYLNGLNSITWSRATPSAPDAQIITSASEYEQLLNEPGGVAAGEFPALFTSNSLYTRLEAVRGGRDTLAAGNARSTTVFESYVFDGNVEKKDGTQSFFRGFENTRATFDAVQNAWYSRRGRMLLARPSLRYFGYGQKCDDGRVPCASVPYPIMDGQFLGVMVSLHSYPLVQKLGWWPNNGNTDVIPYGLDTDTAGPDQYSGTPIHITIPINQPIPRTTGVRSLTFTRVDSAGVAQAPSTYPSSQSSWQQFKIYSSVVGLIVPTIATPAGGQFKAAGPIAALLSNIAVTASNPIAWNIPRTADFHTFTVDAGTDLSTVNVGDILVIHIKAGPYTGVYRYTIAAVNNTTKTVSVNFPPLVFTNLAPDNPAFPNSAFLNNFDNLKFDFESATSTVVSTELDENLQDGEIVMVPLAPLQNNTSYRVSFQIVTPAYDSGVNTFTFTTNSAGIYP